MIELIAAATETAVQAPTAMQTYGPAGALLLALGGWKGVAQGVLWLQGRNGKSNGKNCVPQAECDLRHEKNDQMTAMLTKSIDQLNGSVTRLHERFDEVLRMGRKD